MDENIRKYQIFERKKKDLHIIYARIQFPIIFKQLGTDWLFKIKNFQISHFSIIRVKI